VYCPNCGTNQDSDKPAVCLNCGLPLTGVSEILAQNRAAIERWEAMQAEKRNKMIGAGAFVGISLVPIGLGVYNALTAKKQAAAAVPAPSQPPQPPVP
jgi:uncharacterized membrane protein YvbJ